MREVGENAVGDELVAPGRPPESSGRGEQGPGRMPLTVAVAGSPSMYRRTAARARTSHRVEWTEEPRADRVR
ncbi:hypothetical protein ACIBBB_19055 [Streptomyces sp. NPDC051217]|uniref:hypothetical protein n=1 Tax=Streptomyces sp. NPDC051217 TaxID=3365644 RepID=UPI00379336A1